MIAGVDVAAGLARVGGTQPLYAKFLLHFRKDHLNDVAEIERALRDGAVDTARRRAHSAKGVAATICAERLRCAAGALEAVLKTEEVERVPELLPEFSEALNEVNEAIAAAADHFPTS